MDFVSFFSFLNIILLRLSLFDHYCTYHRSYGIFIFIFQIEKAMLFYLWYFWLSFTNFISSLSLYWYISLSENCGLWLSHINKNYRSIEKNCCFNIILNSDFWVIKKKKFNRCITLSDMLYKLLVILYSNIHVWMCTIIWT